MSSGTQLRCDQEPIHVPGSIQPHGVLLVVDCLTDRIVQAAGPFNELLHCHGAIIDRRFEDIFGAPASTLLEGEDNRRTAVTTRCEGGQLMATAHRQTSLVVVELERAVPARSSEALLKIIDRASRQFSTADSVEDACRFAADALRDVSGYDRVLAYRFSSDGSGLVVSEDPNNPFPTLLNHRFPEPDIPSQARALYLGNPIRVIPDAAYTPAALFPTMPAPLDMTDCLLRSVSPIHLQYLANMGVRASMSVSVLVEGALWGLLAAHSRDARYVSSESRELCKLIGWMLARQIGLLEQTQRLQESQELTAKREEILFALRSGSDPEAQLGVMLPKLCELVHSDGVALVYSSKLQTAGLVPPENQIHRLASWLATKANQLSGFSTDSLSGHLPSATEFSRQASGLLSVSIPAEHPICLIWFRVEQVLEVEWAGNPHAKTLDGGLALSPRKSFSVWREKVRHHSRNWTNAERDSAQLFATRATAILQAQAIRNLNSVLQKMNSELSFEAATDPLTGLANRRAFNRCIVEQWELARKQRHQLSLIMCDVDHFKIYNDQFGHSAGDASLQEVARVLADQRRSANTAARVGGEEFCLLLPYTGLDGALKVAETIREKIQNLGIKNPGSPSGYITISLGVAANDCDNVTNERDLTDSADAALYQAKREGRNRVVSSIRSTIDDRKKSLSSAESRQPE